MLPTAGGEAVQDGESVEVLEDEPHSQVLILLSQLKKKSDVVIYFFF